MAPMNGGYERYRDPLPILSDLSRELRHSQAMPGQWFPLFHALPRRIAPHLVAILLSLSLSVLPTYVPIRDCDPNRSIELDRYAGVGDRSQSAIRLPRARDQLPFFTLERISGILHETVIFEILNWRLGREAIRYYLREIAR